MRVFYFQKNDDLFFPYLKTVFFFFFFGAETDIVMYEETETDLKKMQRTRKYCMKTEKKNENKQQKLNNFIKSKTRIRLSDPGTATKLLK